VYVGVDSCAGTVVIVGALHRVSFRDWLRTHVEDPDVLQLVLAFVRSATYSDDADRLSAVLHLHHGWGALVTRLQQAAAASGEPNDERQLERALDLLQPGWRESVVYRRFLPDVVVSHALVSAETGGFPGRPSGRLPALRNVFLAGDWIGPVGQLADASVASGIAAARSVERLATSQE
jgi:phytoene dehydrogenase-like protein